MGQGSTECLERQDYAIVVQIETVAGVRNAEVIASHDAVDAVILGPYDLSGSFGIPGQDRFTPGRRKHRKCAGDLQAGRKAVRHLRSYC